MAHPTKIMFCKISICGHISGFRHTPTGRSENTEHEIDLKRRIYETIKSSAVKSNLLSWTFWTMFMKLKFRDGEIKYCKSVSA